MRYLVKRDTKEHQRMPFDCLYAPSGWSVVQADSEGWIAHTDNECPLPDDCWHEIKIRDGDVYKDNHSASWDWRKTGSHNDITYYRPILEKVQEPQYDPRSVSFNLLERLKAAHAQAQQIPDLEAELREVLGSMGYDLVARSPFTKDCCGNPQQCFEPCGHLGKNERYVAVAEPDMSDWRNWREGDRIECVAYGARLTVGNIYEVRNTDNEGVDIYADDDGNENSYYLWHFRFHSRPAKGEK